MRYDVRHRTTYRYSQPVSISHHVLRLAPRRCSHQVLHASSIEVTPTPAVRSDALDYFGNPVTYLTIQEQHEHLVIEARSGIDVTAPAPREPSQTTAWDRIFAQLERSPTPDGIATLQFAFDSPYARATPDLAAYARESFPPGRPVLEAACDLTRRIHLDFRYDSAATDVSTPVGEVFRLRRGVCQDFAHLELACLRALALPARYVSGYLLTHPPPGQPKLIGSDASHAWISVWCPEAGWVDLDPTNDALVRDEHVTLAWGRDYGDISPINGVIFGGGEHVIEVAVDVTPTDAHPTEEQQRA
jgi:transglutaminase-like putative cysteine protease